MVMELITRNKGFVVGGIYKVYSYADRRPRFFKLVSVEAKKAVFAEVIVSCGKQHTADLSTGEAEFEDIRAYTSPQFSLVLPEPEKE